MTKAETKKLKHGLYRVYWKKSAGGGMSLAAVGSLHNGDRWIMCANWISFPNTDVRMREAWKDVSHVFLVKTPEVLESIVRDYRP